MDILYLSTYICIERISLDGKIVRALKIYVKLYRNVILLFCLSLSFSQMKQTIKVKKYVYMHFGLVLCGICT